MDIEGRRRDQEERDAGLYTFSPMLCKKVLLDVCRDISHHLVQCSKCSHILLSVQRNVPGQHCSAGGSATMLVKCLPSLQFFCVHNSVVLLCARRTA